MGHMRKEITVCFAVVMQVIPYGKVERSDAQIVDYGAEFRAPA